MRLIDCPCPVRRLLVREEFDHGESVCDKVGTRINPCVDAESVNQIGERLGRRNSVIGNDPGGFNFDLLRGKLFLLNPHL